VDVGTDTTVTEARAPVVRVDVLETFVALLTRSEDNSSPDTFYSSLCEAVCRLTSMDRAIIFRYDEARRQLSGEERDLLWALGKSAALAEAARHATFQQARARQLQERIDLAREVHESVIQRLFGVLLVVSSDAPLPDEARERVTVELQAALRDLRRALQRPLGRAAPDTETTFPDEVARLRDAHPELGIELTPGSDDVGVPVELESLAQSVLVEAVRNARKHAAPTRVEVTLQRQEGAWVMEVSNDGVHGRPRTVSGMGLRLAGLEALQVGGLVEFGEREPGVWRVRLAVPHDRA
jgi:signal transduction histidine kinase